MEKEKKTEGTRRLSGDSVFEVMLSESEGNGEALW